MTVDIETKVGCVGVAGSPGAWFVTPTSVILSNGVNANVTPSGCMLVSGPSGAFSLAGLVAPVSAADGLEVLVVNTLSYTMTIKHQDSADEATAGNRVMSPTGADLVIATPTSGFGYAKLKYIGALSRWLVIDDG